MCLSICLSEYVLVHHEYYYGHKKGYQCYHYCCILVITVLPSIVSTDVVIVSITAGVIVPIYTYTINMLSLTLLHYS